MNQEEKEFLQSLQEQRWDPELLKQKIQLLLRERKEAYHKIPNRY